MHQLDVRTPMGLLFLLLGLVLLLQGFVSDPAIYRAHSLGHNVNLAWGVVFVLFGAVTFWLARRSRQP